MNNELFLDVRSFDQSSVNNVRRRNSNNNKNRYSDGPVWWMRRADIILWKLKEIDWLKCQRSVCVVWMTPSRRLLHCCFHIILVCLISQPTIILCIPHHYYHYRNGHNFFLLCRIFVRTRETDGRMRMCGFGTVQVHGDVKFCRQSKGLEDH